MKDNTTPEIIVDGKYNRLRFNPAANGKLKGDNAGRLKLLFDLPGSNLEVRLHNYVNKPHQEANGGLSLRLARLFKRSLIPAIVATGEKRKFEVVDVTELVDDANGDLYLFTLKPLAA